MTIRPPATIRSGADRRSRPRQVAAALKDWLVDNGLRPGDRLPAEPELIAIFGMAKGTIREALRILEAQGLVRTRTGPGGGAFVDAPTEARAQALLANYFYFKDLRIRDIYELRRILEPENAARLAGRLSEADLARLEAAMRPYHAAARSPEEERAQHIASLDFHLILAELADNALLGFVIGFLSKLLKEQTVHRRLFVPANPELHGRGLAFHGRLLEALRDGDAASARRIMAEHMATAQDLMEAQEATVQKRFMPD